MARSEYQEKERAKKAKVKEYLKRDKALKKEYKTSGFRKGMTQREAAETFNPYAYTTGFLANQNASSAGTLGNHYDAGLGSVMNQMWNPMSDEEIHTLYDKHGLKWNEQKNSRWVETASSGRPDSRKKYQQQYMVNGDWMGQMEKLKWNKTAEGRAYLKGRDDYAFNEDWTPEARRAATARYDERMSNSKKSRPVADPATAKAKANPATPERFATKSNTRKAVAKKIKSRGQKLTASRKSRKLDRATERMF